MSPRGLFACAIVALGCRLDPDPVGFGTNSTMVTTLPAGTTSSTGPGVENSRSTMSSAGTEGSASSPGPRLDLGDKPDLEPPQPAGCKGKIDFLFVISSGGFVALKSFQAGISRKGQVPESLESSYEGLAESLRNRS